MRQMTPLGQDLDNLRRKAEAQGVSFSFGVYPWEHNDNKETITFCCFRNSSKVKGRGALMLEQFLNIADEYHMPVRLWLDGDFEKLRQYYRAFGFREISHLRFLRDAA